MKLKYRTLYSSLLASYEKLSTCSRVQVAAMLVKNGTVVSVGYNGVASGEIHCNELFHEIDGKYYIGEFCQPSDFETCRVTKEEFMKRHHEFSEKNEIHAEVNCLCRALNNHVDITNCDLVISISPCSNCAKMIASAGIKNVYFKDVYDRSAEGIQFLKRQGVHLYKFDEKTETEI